MFSTIKTILGTGDVVSKGISLIDSFHTSPTELIEAKVNAKATLLRAYAPFKVAQRFLAIVFTCTFLASFMLVLVMVLGGWGNVADVKELLAEFYLPEIEFTIIVFYFGGGFLEGSLKSKRSDDVVGTK